MSLGQILFKKTALTISAVNNEKALGLFDGITKALTIPWLYSALLVYAFATMFWLYILQRIPLSLAYPFTALALIIVPIFASLIFSEQLTWSYWIGIIFVITGLVIISH